MNNNSIRVTLVISVMIFLGVIGYEKLPLWRNFRANTPFGGELRLPSNVRVEANKWISVDEAVFTEIEEAYLSDDYGTGLVKVTSRKRRSNSLEIWLVKRSQN
jgi:hypothetical protein